MSVRKCSSVVIVMLKEEEVITRPIWLLMPRKRHRLGMMQAPLSPTTAPVGREACNTGMT